jgi:hypothetical protein
MITSAMLGRNNEARFQRSGNLCVASWGFAAPQAGMNRAIGAHVGCGLQFEMM